MCESGEKREFQEERKGEEQGEDEGLVEGDFEWRDEERKEDEANGVQPELNGADAAPECEYLELIPPSVSESCIVKEGCTFPVYTSIYLPVCVWAEKISEGGLHKSAVTGDVVSVDQSVEENESESHSPCFFFFYYIFSAKMLIKKSWRVILSSWRVISPDTGGGSGSSTSTTASVRLIILFIIFD